MKLINSENENKYILGEPKRWFCLRCEENDGNLCITYDSNNRVYIITRTDNKPFDGQTEDVGGIYVGNMKKPCTLEEIIEDRVNALTDLQIDPETNMFLEFDWTFNDDKTKIIVVPVFLESIISVEMNLPSDDDKSFNGLTLSARFKKTIRNKINRNIPKEIEESEVLLRVKKMFSK